MTNTKPDWRLTRIAAAVAVSVALLSMRETGWGQLKTAAAQTTTASTSTNLEILEVRPSFFVIAGGGANVGVQVGEDGVVVVDTGTAADAQAILAAIKRISPKPIRDIIDTGPDADHIGGNQALAKAGERVLSGGGGRNTNSMPPIIAVENMLRHLTRLPPDALPNETFHYPRKYMYLNGEAI